MTLTSALLGLVLGVLFLVSAGSFVVAVQHPPTVVDPEYYRNGINYGRDSHTPSWELAAALTPDHLEVSVVDAAGAPVPGGTLLLRWAGGERGGAAVSFTEGSPGVYVAPRERLPGGDLRGTLHFSRGSSRGTRRMVILK